ncbi:YceD family protein [Selenihalanaerobacter shriftii]|uniref:DUF177 domain-containing protein n=1 Tax=Selenihalanaerobacter shriftii TaxID=142842 RepID=A0A1T4LKP9_9FIRM|nr:DUF177 domain-containing protein [Selenihalanaerobacter shriftii]SJZ55127.1 uncharacterized protein SAMN02745118_01178 [Selenihalanaerobacter shriftii]
MIINISDIRENLGAIKEVKLEEEIEDIQFQDREIQIDGPAKMAFQVINTEDSFLVVGDIDLNLNVKCSRCLDEFTLPVTAKLEEEVEKDRVELSGAASINIEEEIEDNVFLAIPMKPVCDEDCAGICPSCGQDLNEGDCDCFMHTVDPRLAKLEQLLDKD